MCKDPEAKVSLEFSRNVKKGTVAEAVWQGGVGGGDSLGSWQGLS